VDFSPKAPDASPLSAGPSLLDLPEGLPVTVELTSPSVRGDRAAAGDRIEGRLVNAIRDRIQGVTLVPAGAALVGRLMRVETRWGPPAEITFVLRWETVDVEGTPKRIGLRPNRQVQITRATRDALQGRGVEIELPFPGEERYGINRVAGEQGVLESGLRSEWITTKP
jgi:hypothetical protein